MLDGFIKNNSEKALKKYRKSIENLPENVG